jgi:hypothetical protein
MSQNNCVTKLTKKSKTEGLLADSPGLLELLLWSTMYTTELSLYSKVFYNILHSLKVQITSIYIKLSYWYLVEYVYVNKKIYRLT